LGPSDRPAVGRLGIALVIDRRFPRASRRRILALGELDETEEIAAFDRVWIDGASSTPLQVIGPNETPS
jgi:hypothetical protein